jgi:D-alanyl-D-alanine carboxypeptidase
VVEAGKKRHIASEEVFNGLGYNWKNIIWVNQFVGILLPDGEPLYVRIATNTSTPQTTTPTPTPTDSDNANNGGQPSEENPVELLEKTPEDKVSYIGTQFTTDMDAYIIADYTTGKILAGKNIDTVRPMASFVKVMTGYQLLVDGINLNNPTTYNSATQKAAYHNFRIAEGEKILNKDLMSAMLVSSINTPARMLVNRTINQEAAFIKRMNATAKSIGATKTVFTDSYGFDTKNVTTARDYLSIFLTAVKNADMRAYLGAKNYQYDEVLDKDGKPHHYDISSNVLANKSGLPYSIVASKTGFLYESGTGLAMMIERPGDKKQFIVITMGNPEFDETKRFDAPDQLARWTIENL